VKNIKRLLVLKNIYLSAALIWTCSILVLCLASFSNLPDVGVKNADKYVHFTFHFVFVLLWALYYNYKNAESIFKSTVVILIVSFLFGIIIEIAQQVFTSNRKFDILDVSANTTGAFSALLIILIFHFANKSISKVK
jgi:glycopeptide antibiotics resistance protein